MDNEAWAEGRRNDVPLGNGSKGYIVKSFIVPSESSEF